jgi:hypothetical protein
MRIRRQGMVRKAAAMLVALAFAVVAVSPIAADEGVLEIPASPAVVAFFADQGVSSATVSRTYDQLSRAERQALWAIEADAGVSETLKSIVSSSLARHLSDGVYEVRMLVAGTVYTITR